MARKRISTCISASTKDLVEQYAEVHGVKKSYLVEQALLHHLRALHELPADILIPPRIMVRPASFGSVIGLVKTPRKPTKALRALLAGNQLTTSSEHLARTRIVARISDGRRRAAQSVPPGGGVTDRDPGRRASVRVGRVWNRRVEQPDPELP
jgi:hypothetical protein